MKHLNLFLGGLSLVATGAYAQSQQQQTHPNVIYVFPDQFRNDACGFWKQEDFKKYRKAEGDPTITPNLDKFARESLVLTSAQSNNPVSSPHRAMLMTGMYSAEKNGVPVNCNTDSPNSSLNPEAITVGDVFSQAGYDCAYFGKYHLDAPTPNDPQRPGKYVQDQKVVWDAYTPKERRHSFNYWYSYGTFDEHKNPHYWDNEGHKHEPHEYSPVYEAKKVIEYMKNTNNVRDPKKPFLIMVGMNPPHSPYTSFKDCMEEDYNLYKDMPMDALIRPNVTNKNLPKVKSTPYYFANVTGVDRAFGMILDALKKLGLEENTIVVFASDHGELMCSHELSSEAKNMPYAEAMNIPFIVRYPGKIAHRVDPLLLSTPDIMPTLSGLAGVEKFVPSDVQGKNYAELFFDANSLMKRPTGALYMKNGFGKKNQKGENLGYSVVARGIKTAKYTLAFTVTKENKINKMFFFDDEKDPYQLNCLPLKGNEKIVKELGKELGRQLKAIDDPWYKEKILKDLISYK